MTERLIIKNKNIILISIIVLIFIFSSCVHTGSDTNATEPTILSSNRWGETDASKPVEDRTVNVNFTVGQKVEKNEPVKESINEAKKLGREHSVKYYSYQPSSADAVGDFSYYDVFGQKHVMNIDPNVEKQKYEWDFETGVLSKVAPKGYKMTYGVDISKHNGDLDFEKIKSAGFEFVFIRSVYRRYGRTGKVSADEKAAENIKKAKAAGLKVGVYVFSQAINEKEAIEEADFTINFLKDFEIDLPVIFDAETIKYDIARTDNVTGEQFTKNAVAFLEKIKSAGYTPAVYTNMVWQDYYYDMSKLKNYEIWYADYNEIPQTPYDFKYWQFSETGVIEGIDKAIDLNVMFTKE